MRYCFTHKSEQSASSYFPPDEPGFCQEAYYTGKGADDCDISEAVAVRVERVAQTWDDKEERP